MIRKIKVILFFIFNLIKIKIKVLYFKKQFIYKQSLHNKDNFDNNSDYKILGDSISSWGDINYINFRLDPRSKIEIKNTISCLIRPYYYKNFDIKYIWEISRFQFIPYISKKEQLNKANELIKSFIASNPVGFGPNWMCAMEVSIRAVNICEYVDLFNEENILSDIDRRLYSKFIYEHFLFIYYNLEKNPKGYSGNHYLSNLVGLIIISNRFILSSFDIKIVNYVISEIDKELRIQFSGDGSYFENSTMYHRLATEMVYYMLEICNKFETSLTNETLKNYYSSPVSVSLFSIGFFKKILIKSVNFLSDISSSQGKLIVIGDNDSGRFMDLDYMGNFDDTTASYLLQKCYENYNINDENGLTLKPTEFFKNANNMNNINCVFYELNLETYSFKEYADFGLYVFRGESFFLTIRTNYSSKKMVHAHEDLLSINLIIKGVILLWDPGMPTYTRDRKLRDEYRFANTHNSPLLSDLESLNLNTFEFKLIKRPIIRKSDIKANRFEVGLEKNGLFITRKITFYKNGLLIEDAGSEKLYPYLRLNKSFSPKYGEIVNNS